MSRTRFQTFEVSLCGANWRGSRAKIRFAAVSGLVTFDDQHNPVKSATILAVKPDGVKFEAIVNP